MSSKKSAAKAKQATLPVIDPVALLHALPTAVLTVDRDYRIHSLNPAAEDCLGGSLAALQGREITQYLYPVTSLVTLVDTAFEKQTVVREYEVELHGPRIGSQHVNLQAVPLLPPSLGEGRGGGYPHPNLPPEGEGNSLVILTIEKLAAHIALHPGPTQEFSRSTAGMAAILAHELKNPLSGIKGAAQLLEKKLMPDDARLTGLIASEVDRISHLINEMEIFSDETMPAFASINVHEVLQHVKRVAENGFAKHVTFVEHYDPSLPEIPGNRDRLVQLFLNLVKNAAEALSSSRGLTAGSPEVCASRDPAVKPRDDATITLSTAYKGGHKFRRSDTDAFQALPIQITVEDNGPGVPEDVRPHLFDPFVTTKQGGKGLGLAIVSKIIALHGAAIDTERTLDGATRFKVMLPVSR